MEIKEIRDNELKKVNTMYENFITRNSDWKGDSLDYIKEKLFRCEKCGSLFEIEDKCEIHSLLENKNYTCCHRCSYEIEWDNFNYDEDLVDYE